MAHQDLECILHLYQTKPHNRILSSMRKDDRNTRWGVHIHRPALNNEFNRDLY